MVISLRVKELIPHVKNTTTFAEINSLFADGKKRKKGGSGTRLQGAIPCYLVHLKD